MRKISYAGEIEDAVQVAGRNLPISRKIGRELAVFIKGKTVDRAIAELKQVAAGEIAVPYKRFNHDTPHRKGNMMSGRFPIKASLEIIKLIESLKANAEQKALDSDAIKIIHASCQHGTLAWHYGRKRRRRRKLAHFELVGVEVEEQEEKKYGGKKKAKAEKVVQKAPVKKTEKKAEKKEVKKEAPKKEAKSKKVTESKTSDVSKKTASAPSEKAEDKKETKAPKTEEVKVEKKDEEVKEKKAEAEEVKEVSEK